MSRDDVSIAPGILLLLTGLTSSSSSSAIKRSSLRFNKRQSQLVHVAQTHFALNSAACTMNSSTARLYSAPSLVSDFFYRFALSEFDRTSMSCWLLPGQRRGRPGNTGQISILVRNCFNSNRKMREQDQTSHSSSQSVKRNG